MRGFLQNFWRLGQCKMGASVSTWRQSGGGATTLAVSVNEDIKPDITRLEAQRTCLRYHDMRQSAVTDACDGVWTGYSRCVLGRASDAVASARI